VRHWDDMNRLAASLKDGLVRPSLVVSKLQAMQRQNPLQQAIQELVQPRGNKAGGYRRA
jgi:TnpA family transposase